MQAEVEVPAVGFEVEAPTDGREEPLRKSDEPRRYDWLVGGGPHEEPRHHGWLVGGGAACLGSTRRIQSVPYARNSGLEGSHGRDVTLGVGRAGEFGMVARSDVPGRRRAGSWRPALRSWLAAEAYDDGCC